MAFEVREFEVDSNEDHIFWNFKISNINNSQLDFYSQEASSRSLFHLSQDLVTHLDQAIEKKHKSQESKNRLIRKLCEKILKEMKINIESFAQEVPMLICRSLNKST